MKLGEWPIDERKIKNRLPHYKRSALSDFLSFLLSKRIYISCNTSPIVWSRLLLMVGKDNDDLLWRVRYKVREVLSYR
jgi:hypothetical protein